MYPHLLFEFCILLALAVIGSIAILPYSLRLLSESKKKKPIKMSPKALLLLSVLQNAVVFAIVIGIGLYVGHQIGLGTRLIDEVISGGSMQQIIIIIFTACICGIIGGVLLMLLDLLFLPHFPEKLLTTALKTTQWENFTASFYGGINEELFMRLFGVSLVAWIMSRILHMTNGLSTTADFWIAIIIMAVLFAIGHLPTLKNLLGTITPVMFLRSMLLNTPIGLLCGWIFWHYGIEAAIITHFVVDIIYHVGGTYVVRSKYAKFSDKSSI